MKKSIFKIFTLLAIVSLLISCNSDDVSMEETIYEVGDIGPAGGLIIYSNNTQSNSFNYIEVASEDLSSSGEWGCFNNSVADARNSEIGTGKSNTEAIVNFHNSLDDYYNTPSNCSDNSNGTVAAKIATDYSVNGYDDWFLPSKDESKLMYDVLHLNGKGNFITDDDGVSPLYWTSTEHDNNTAVTMDFSNGNQGFLCKQCDFGLTRIRVIRYF